MMVPPIHHALRTDNPMLTMYNITECCAASRL
ncbi:hypothetical protein RR11_2753 [Ruegeria sp. R11]|nr:hypothetical protein RR11_2753 [Ruegeria sp. R11]